MDFFHVLLNCLLVLLTISDTQCQISKSPLNTRSYLLLIYAYLLFLIDHCQLCDVALASHLNYYYTYFESEWWRMCLHPHLASNSFHSIFSWCYWACVLSLGLIPDSFFVSRPCLAWCQACEELNYGRRHSNCGHINTTCFYILTNNMMYKL